MISRHCRCHRLKIIGGMPSIYSMRNLFDRLPITFIMIAQLALPPSSPPSSSLMTSLDCLMNEAVTKFLCQSIPIGNLTWELATPNHSKCIHCRVGARYAYTHKHNCPMPMNMMYHVTVHDSAETKRPRPVAWMSAQVAMVNKWIAYVVRRRWRMPQQKILLCTTVTTAAFSFYRGSNKKMFCGVFSIKFLLYFFCVRSRSFYHQM